MSLSDRFGLWLGFHKCSQDEYLAMVFGYIDHFGLEGDRDGIRAEAVPHLGVHSLDQRAFAHAARAPEQRIVGR